MNSLQEVFAKPIITLTLNPALDLSTTTNHVHSGHKLRCHGSRIDPGGGGTNVARVIHRLGGHVLAAYTAGGTTGDTYRKLMEAEGIPALVLAVHGNTRQDFTVNEYSLGRQFRFVLEGAELSDDEWHNFLGLVQRSIRAGGYVVASGSLPPGVPPDFYARVARLARDADARCVVDSSGPALTEALAEGVFLVKPSRRELAEHTGVALDSDESQIAAAMSLIAGGSAQFVALTLAESGAILASRTGVVHLPAPAVRMVSAVGAGDSFLGALVLRLAQGHAPESALRTAVAAGSAAVITPATELCRPEDVVRLEAALAAMVDVDGPHERRR